MNKERLNVGCRTDYKEGWVNIDIDKNVKADVHMDLTKYPYPFKDGQFDEVLACAILEHIPEPSKVLKELHRVTKHGGLIYILVPHSADPMRYSDLTHINFFNSQTFKHWSNKDLYPLFEVLKNKISFTRINHPYLNKIFNPLINASENAQTLYERFFTGFFQSTTIVFILRVRKDKEFYDKKIRDMHRLDSIIPHDNFKFIRDI